MVDTEYLVDDYYNYDHGTDGSQQLSGLV